LERYALIGDCQTAALVGANGSIDWLCLPRFDSRACFAALLGDSEHGRWRISSAEAPRSVAQRYRDGTLILETALRTSRGAVRLVDFMPLRGDVADVIRFVEGVEGSVPMRLDLTLRADYGDVVPWVRRTPDGLTAIAGPDSGDSGRRYRS
jgi:GH15 family glucan-1,4-alpha-glucosidase